MVQKKTCGVIPTKCGKHIENEMALENGSAKQKWNATSVVYNHWTGLVDWTGGLDWWTRLKSFYAL